MFLVVRQQGTPKTTTLLGVTVSVKLQILTASYYLSIFYYCRKNIHLKIRETLQNYDPLKFSV